VEDAVFVGREDHGVITTGVHGLVVDANQKHGLIKVQLFSRKTPSSMSIRTREAAEESE